MVQIEKMMYELSYDCMLTDAMGGSLRFVNEV